MIKRLENEQKHCMYAFQRFLEVLPNHSLNIALQNKLFYFGTDLVKV